MVEKKTNSPDDAGMLSYPLLPEFSNSSKKTNNSSANHSPSVSGLVFNVSTSIIGAGIMSIPATLEVLGVIPAIILIIVIAILTNISVDFLLRFTHSGKTTYAGVMGESFGWLGSLVVQICIMITTLGCLIIYLIIIGDVLSGTGSTLEGNVHLGILQEWFGIHWWNSRPFTILFIVIFVILPLVLQRRIDSLRFTSAISVFLAVVFVAISTVMAITALWEGKRTSPRLLPANQSSVFKLFTAVPVIVTAFTFQSNVHPIRAELNKPSDMKLAVWVSLVISVAIYSTVGLSGYLLFGDSTMSDVLANFNDTNLFDSKWGWLLNDIIRLSYALHLMLVFPLLNFTLRVNVDELFFCKPKWPALASHTARFVPLTCSLLLFMYILAIVIPNIWYFFQFIGSTTSLCIAFIFPGAIVLRDYHGISTGRDKILAVLMIVLAVSASSIAISSNVRSMFRSNL